MEIRFRATGEVMTTYTFNAQVCSLPITPELLDQYNADPVFEGPQAATIPPYQFSYRDGVEQQSDGKWYTKYSAGPVFQDTADKTAAQQMDDYKAAMDADQARSVRASRNALLATCDWTQLADSPADKAVWGAYRQALRDVSSQAGFPWTVEWPVAPV